MRGAYVYSRIAYGHAPFHEMHECVCHVFFILFYINVGTVRRGQFLLNDFLFFVLSVFGFEKQNIDTAIIFQWSHVIHKK